MRYKELAKLVDLAKPVEVYKNLHKGVWSIRQAGKVVAHSDYVFLADAKFVVRPGGRARVLREKRKNVHAFVKGFVVPPSVAGVETDGTWKDISYNPYQHSTFVTGETPVSQARYVDMFIDEAFPNPVIASGAE